MTGAGSRLRRQSRAIAAGLPRARGQPDQEGAQRQGEGGRARTGGIGDGAEEEDFVGQRNEAARTGERQRRREPEQQPARHGRRRRIRYDDGRIAAIAPIGGEGARRHRRIDRDGDIDRALHADERKEKRSTGKARCAGAKRIDVIKKAERAPHMAGTTDQMADQNRQRRSHQQGRNDHQRQTDRGRRRQWQTGGERADLVENLERQETKGPGHQLDAAKQRQQRDAAPLRQPTAGEAAETEAKHKRGDHDCDQLDIDAKDAK